MRIIIPRSNCLSLYKIKFWISTHLCRVAHVRAQWIVPSLVQIMVLRLFGTNALHQPILICCQSGRHDDVIKWKHFPRYWPFVWGIHRLTVNSLHKGQWRGALMFSLIYGWINGWVNNRAAGDLRRHRGHYGVIVMIWIEMWWFSFNKLNSKWSSAVKSSQ